MQTGERMKVAVFSMHAFKKPYLIAANKNLNYQLEYFDVPLSSKTALLAKRFPVISCFVTDELVLSLGIQKTRMQELQDSILDDARELLNKANVQRCLSKNRDRS